jgi:hypothetical protein
MGSFEDPKLKELLNYSCYDVCPVSTKVVVFDTKLLVSKAISILTLHGTLDQVMLGFLSAPLYNASSKEFEGVLTVTDFIRMILYLEKSCTSYDAVIISFS